MDKNSTFGQLFEQGKTALDDSASNVVDTTKQQILGNPVKTQNQPNIQNKELQSQLSDESREIVNDFYAPSQNADATQQNADDQQEKLVKVRDELQKLHAGLHQTTYYEPLFAYEKKQKDKAQEAQNDEVVEEQEKMTELDKQEKKKVDLAKFKAQRSVEIKGDVTG